MNRELEIFRSVVRALEAFTGTTPSGLADKAGIARSTVNKPMRQEVAYAPKSRTAETLLVKAGGLTESQAPAYLAAMRESPGLSIRAFLESYGEGGMPIMSADGQHTDSEAEFLASVDPSMVANLPRTLPLKRTVEGPAEDGEFTMIILEGDSKEYTQRPRELAGIEGAYAFRMIGRTMEPLFRDGSRVLVHTGRTPAEGDHVLIHLVPREGQEIAAGRSGPYIVRRLVGRTTTHLRLEQYRPHRDDIDLERSRVVDYWRILTMDDLFT